MQQAEERAKLARAVAELSKWALSAEENSDDYPCSFAGQLRWLVAELEDTGGNNGK